MTAGGERDRRTQGCDVDLLLLKQRRGQCGRVSEHSQQQVIGGDLAAGGSVRGVLGRDHGVAGPRRETPEALV